MKTTTDSKQSSRKGREEAEEQRDGRKEQPTDHPASGAQMIAKQRGKAIGRISTSRIPSARTK